MMNVIEHTIDTMQAVAGAMAAIVLYWRDGGDSEYGRWRVKNSAYLIIPTFLPAEPGGMEVTKARSAVEAGTKLVLRNAVQRDELDRCISISRHIYH